MRKPLISIIVPVYNVEKYVKQCLESILEQNFSDYEVIVVNDGSTDRSLQICEEIARKDSRIRLFSTENSGVSHARNLGIKEATGKWMMFLDSDDYLVENCLSILEQNIDEQVQEIYGNYMTEKEMSFSGDRGVMNAQDVAEMIKDSVNQNKFPPFYTLQQSSLLGVWGKLFLAEIVRDKKIYFDEKLKLSEDMLFHLCYLNEISHVLLIDTPVFYFRKHDASVTKKFKEEYVGNRLYLFELLEKKQLELPILEISTMLLLNIQIEKETSGKQRRILEEKLKCYWKDNKKILLENRGKAFSLGKWQNIVYKICVELFMKDNYKIAFLILRIYVKLFQKKKV